jgi:MFS family permease
LTAAHLCGALGAGLAVAAGALRDMPLLLAGCALLGCGNAAVMLARYAAADLASRRGRSMSTVVTAASVGAVVAPNLLGPAGGLARNIGLPDATGLFLLAIPAFLIAALVLIVFLRPDPLLLAKATSSAGVVRPVAAAGQAHALVGVLAHREIRLALLVLSTSNLTMVAIMAVTPVHMHAHGAGLDMVGLVISAHIAAMYVPSPLTGALSDRFGARRVGASGALLLVATGAVALIIGSGVAATVVVLLMLGLGWNASLIGGSALLREARVEPSQQTWAEGLGELGMGAAAAVGGGGAGVILGSGGFATLCVVAAAPCLLLLGVIAAERMAADSLPAAGTVPAQEGASPR